MSGNEEGELKRRIQAEQFTMDETYPNEIAYIDDILKVVEDAKKEFENLCDSNYRVNVGKEYLEFWSELDQLIKRLFGT